MMSTRETSLPIVTTSAAEAAHSVATEIAELIRARRRGGRAAVLGLPTGRTPLAVYAALVELHRHSALDFSNVVTFNLDEYLGLAPQHPQTFRRYMREHLFDAVGLDPANAWIPASDVAPAQVEAHCREYESAILAAGGIDLMLLGIGRNGHIGFNEPGSARDSRTREVRLAESTREDCRAHFGGAAHVPERAITMGVATILAARRIRVLAFGAAKREIVRRTLDEATGPALPATYLRGHADVKLFVDAEARPAS